MYIGAYDDPQLAGIGKKLKKVTKSVTKVAKKVVKPALHIGAAIATGGASLAVSAQMLAAKKAKKQAEAQANAEQAQTAALIQAANAPITPPPSVAPAAAPVMPVSTVAPAATAVAQLQPTPTVPTYTPFYEGGTPAPQRSSKTRKANAASRPPWLIPAAIAGVGLVAVFALKGRSSN